MEKRNNARNKSVFTTVKQKQYKYKEGNHSKMGGANKWREMNYVYQLLETSTHCVTLTDLFTHGLCKINRSTPLTQRILT